MKQVGQHSGGPQKGGGRGSAAFGKQVQKQRECSAAKSNYIVYIYIIYYIDYIIIRYLNIGSNNSNIGIT